MICKPGKEKILFKWIKTFRFFQILKQFLELYYLLSEKEKGTQYESPKM